MKKVIFDVDNVLADSMNCWCKKASRYLGYTVSKKEIKTHKIIGSVNMAASEIFRLQEEVWKEWEQLPPTEKGIPEKIQALRDNGFKVYVATSRPQRSSQLVKNWIKNIGIPNDAFYSLGPYRFKAEIEADILVDDGPEHVEKFIAADRIGLIFEQPWNEKLNISKAITVSTIKEAVNHILNTY